MCVGYVCLNNFRIEDRSANSTRTRAAQGSAVLVHFYDLIFTDVAFRTQKNNPWDYPSGIISHNPPPTAHLLLGVCVLVHGAQGILDPGQPGREAQQQVHHHLQVTYEQAVPLQFHRKAVFTDQQLQGRPVGRVVLNLRLEGAAHLIQGAQALLDVRH